jgi:ribosomal protein L29
MIDILEYRKKSQEDLKKELLKLKKDLQKTVSDILQKKEKNIKKAVLFRKDIARVNTLINEKLKEVQK